MVIYKEVLLRSFIKIEDMNKSFYLWMSVLVLTIAGLSSCSSDDDLDKGVVDGEIIEPVLVSESVIQYFDKRFTGIKTGVHELFFEPELGENGPVLRPLIVINSQEELAQIISEEPNLPEIDFSNCSLVLGICSYSDNEGDKVPIDLLSQKLYKTTNGYQMVLSCSYRIKRADSLPIVEYLNFWGVYPKLESLPMKAEIRYGRK